MPQLFMDPLDLWLDVLGTTLLATAYWVYLNFASKAPVSVKSTFNKSFGYFYLGLGIYALASGLWAAATWPLPSSYNLVFSDAWPLFGVALITLGLVVTRWGAEAFGDEGRYYLLGGLIGVAALSLVPFVYSFDIWMYGLTTEPPLAGLMFFAIGLAGLLSPLLAHKGAAKPVAYLLILLLAVAGLISLFIGVGAIFAHTGIWKSWAPWYGVH